MASRCPTFSSYIFRLLTGRLGPSPWHWFCGCTPPLARCSGRPFSHPWKTLTTRVTRPRMLIGRVSTTALINHPDCRELQADPVHGSSMSAGASVLHTAICSIGARRRRKKAGVHTYFTFGVPDALMFLMLGDHSTLPMVTRRVAGGGWRYCGGTGARWQPQVSGPPCFLR